MTDIVAPSSVPRVHVTTSEEAQARLRARYRAEARFKFYGIAAIVFAGLVLVVLMSDIISKAWPAFIEHRVVLTVTPTLEQVSTDGRTDRAGLVGGDYTAPLRAALQAEFPDATDRAVRRKLNADILSSGADVTLRNLVLADPAVIGKPVRTGVLLDDAADLYFKGAMTGRTERAGRGAVTPTGTTGEITLFSSSNDFGADVVDLKRALSVTAAGLRTEADRLRRGAAGLSAGAEKTELERKANEAAASAAALEARFNTTGTAEDLDTSTPSKLVMVNGGVVKLTSIRNALATGTVLAALSSTDEAKPGTWKILTLEQPEDSRKLGDQQIAWLEKLKEKGQIETAFATRFFTSGDSRESELAGILGSLTGSALTMLVTLLLCLPTGVAAAIYLEEFAPKNQLTDLIEVNINNLAAVPSIVFGLLGLAMFLNFFGMPRSSPLVGGLVMALLVLPTIIIASRAALKAVPPSIREAALGVGASHQQAVFHHVVPLAMPGIMTGTIIGMAHALGETAPLLLIGMVAFIVDVPTSITGSATALPVQIYLWSDLPEAGFQAKTAAAILVLLAFLLVMNGAAIMLRRRFERRW